jgi:hypothetical protein
MERLWVSAAKVVVPGLDLRDTIDVMNEGAEKKLGAKWSVYTMELQRRLYAAFSPSSAGEHLLGPKKSLLVQRAKRARHTKRKQQDQLQLQQQAQQLQLQEGQQQHQQQQQQQQQQQAEQERKHQEGFEEALHASKKAQVPSYDEVLSWPGYSPELCNKFFKPQMHASFITAMKRAGEVAVRAAQTQRKGATCATSRSPSEHSMHTDEVAAESPLAQAQAVGCAFYAKELTILQAFLEEEDEEEGEGEEEGGVMGGGGGDAAGERLQRIVGGKGDGETTTKKKQRWVWRLVGTLPLPLAPSEKESQKVGVETWSPPFQLGEGFLL